MGAENSYCKCTALNTYEIRFKPGDFHIPFAPFPNAFLKHFQILAMNHSDVPMIENPTNIPRVPPTVPTREIHVVTRYSVRTVLYGSRYLECCDEGVANFNPNTLWTKPLPKSVFILKLRVLSILYSLIMHALLQCMAWVCIKYFKAALEHAN